MQLTSQDIQRYVRIGLQYLASYLVTAGMIDPNASWIQPVTGALVGLATLGWTVYGNRIQAKIDEIYQVIHAPEATKDTKIQVTNLVAALPENKTIESTLGSDPRTAANVVVPSK